MSTANFRNNITTFRRLSIKSHLLFDKRVSSFRDPEDQLLIDLLNNIDFDILYRSEEFKTKLEQRIFILHHQK